MVARQGLSVLISLLTVLLVIRNIGPAAYGIYSSAIAVYFFPYAIAQLGVGVYLVRQEGILEEKDYHQGFTILLLAGLLAVMLAFIALPWVALWVRMEEFRPVTAVILAGLPMQLISHVPLARLERDLNYRHVAAIEMLGHLLFLLVAWPLAVTGLGPWAPAAGWWTQVAFNTTAFYISSGYRPRWVLEKRRVFRILSYGLGFVSSLWVWQMRNLVNPLIVGRFAGAEAVGIVAFAIRIAEILSFPKNAIWRISISAFAKLQDNRRRMVHAVEEGTSLQVLVTGLLLLFFIVVGKPIIGSIFGDRWLPVMGILPFIFLGYLANCVFNLQISALYVLKMNGRVASFHLTHLFCLAGSAFFLVSQKGFMGYGWAEVVTLMSYALLHTHFVRTVGLMDYKIAAVWGGAFAIALFLPYLGLLSLLPVILALLWPRTWSFIFSYIREFRHRCLLATRE